MAVRLVGMVVLVALVLGFTWSSPAPQAPLTTAVTAVVDQLPVVGRMAGDVLSEIRPERPFSLVGATVPDGARVLMRTAEGTGPWSPWLELEPLAHDGDGPDPGSAEVAAVAAGWQRMSEPVWTGPASRLQLRVTDGHLDEVRVHLVDTLGPDGSLGSWVGEVIDSLLGPPATPPPAPRGPVDRPPIVTRAQWGADESRRRGGPDYGTPRAGMLHHTVTANDYTPEQAPAVVRAIYAYHTGSLGWDDIGYNLLVDRFGRVYEGRAGGVERGVVGAHAGGFNTETFGVSVLGTFTEELPSEPALAAVTEVVAWKLRLHGINPDPNATVVIQSRGSTRYPAGHHARMHTLSGHRDVSTTACPGAALYAHLHTLRHRIFARST